MAKSSKNKGKKTKVASESSKTTQPTINTPTAAVAKESLTTATAKASRSLVPSSIRKEFLKLEDRILNLEKSVMELAERLK